MRKSTSSWAPPRSESPATSTVIDQDFIRERSAPHFRLKANVHRGHSLVAPGNHGQLEPRRIDTGDHRGVSRGLGPMVGKPRAQPEPRPDGRIGAELRGKQQDRAGRRLRQDLDHAEPRRRGIVAWRGGRFERGTSIGFTRTWARTSTDPCPMRMSVAALLNGEVVGIANGRAEFGPRALGNRSLIADPRGRETKDRVNRIKKREPFRPFAPVIMAEFADTVFRHAGTGIALHAVRGPREAAGSLSRDRSLRQYSPGANRAPRAASSCSTISCHASTKRPAVRCC